MTKDPTGGIVRNQFDLQHLSNGLSKEMADGLRALFDEIAAEVVRIDPTASRRTERTALLARLARMIGKTYEAALKESRIRLAEIGVQQGAEATEQLRRSLGGVRVTLAKTPIGMNRLKGILDTDPIRGTLLADWFTGASDTTINRVLAEIRIGVLEGEPIEDIVRRVRGRRAGTRVVDGQKVPRYVGGVLETTTRAARTIIRTAVTDIAAQSHVLAFEANQDVTETYRYTATLDGRTSFICMTLDGKVFRYDDGRRKLPPQHLTCRSVIVPIVDFAGLGLDPPVEGKRAAKGGAVDASTDYGQWLRAQDRIDPKVTDDILGPGRAKLFRDRKITLDQLVRSDGRTVTVAELQARAA